MKSPQNFYLDGRQKTGTVFEIHKKILKNNPMKNSRRDYPQVNAGSMADIAFLLLIFFLVTAVIPKDKGISRKLPSICPPGQICDADIKQKNILEIYINAENKLLVDDEIIKLEDLKTKISDFLDNNGDRSCNYCSGIQLETSSDNPKKAVISLKNDLNTTYEFYIKIQDEITKAYFDLRRAYAEREFGKVSSELTKEELQIVRDAYPFKLSEAEIK